MLTLKVITRDLKGLSETHILYGERIQHIEMESHNYQMKFSSDEQVIGSLPDKESEQKFVFSRVFIFGDNGVPKILLYIMPHADCFVMYNGKTVDSFSTVYR